MFAGSAAVLVLFAVFALQHLRSAPSAEDASARVPQQEAGTEKEQTSTAAGEESDEGRQVSARKTTAAPEATVEELVRAWNSGETEKIAALFLQDGVLEMPTGSEIHSREEIKKTITEHRNGMLRESTLTSSVKQIANPDEATAVIKGTYRIDGVKILGFTTSSDGTYEIRETLRDGRWQIARANVKRE